MMIEHRCYVLSKEEKKAWEQIKKAETIIITAHVCPDGDAIGSSLAMFRYCCFLGKKAKVVIDDLIPTNFSYLEDVKEIVKPRSSELIGADLLIIMDAAPRRIGSVADGSYKCVLNIDHHETNHSEIEYSIIHAEYPSVSELLFWIFASIKHEIDVETAKCLYTGILTDTNFFRAPGICDKTFECAAELARIGADVGKIAECIETKDFEESQLVAQAICEMKRFLDGSIVGVTLDERYDELEVTDSIIDSIRYIRGVKIAFLLKHEKSGFRVRLRSQAIDVSTFAKSYGGGGHRDAAGFNIEAKDKVKAENELVEKLEEWFELHS